MKIIIADDDRDLSMLLKERLVKAGHMVIWSSNSPDVGDLVRQEPDLVLLDINLRNVDGGDICTELKEDVRTREIPVILMSGIMDLKQISEMCGADGYLLKPFDFQEFDRVISICASGAKESV